MHHRALQRDESGDCDDFQSIAATFASVRESALNQSADERLRRFQDFTRPKSGGDDDEEHNDDGNNSSDAAATAAANSVFAALAESTTSAPPSTFYAALRADNNRDTFVTLLVVTAAMLVLPLLTYALFDALILPATELAPHHRWAISGAAAVLVVVVIAVGFGIYALLEAED